MEGCLVKQWVGWEMVSMEPPSSPSSLVLLPHFLMKESSRPPLTAPIPHIWPLNPADLPCPPPLLSHPHGASALPGLGLQMHMPHTGSSFPGLSSGPLLILLAALRFSGCLRGHLRLGFHFFILRPLSGSLRCCSASHGPLGL